MRHLDEVQRRAARARALGDRGAPRAPTSAPAAGRAHRRARRHGHHLGLRSRRHHGVATSVTCRADCPRSRFPSIPAHLWPGVFGAAVGIAIVAFSGNVLTARAFAQRLDRPRRRGPRADRARRRERGSRVAPRVSGLVVGQPHRPGPRIGSIQSTHEPRGRRVHRARVGGRVAGARGVPARRARRPRRVRRNTTHRHPRDIRRIVAFRMSEADDHGLPRSSAWSRSICSSGSASPSPSASAIWSAESPGLMTPCRGSCPTSPGCTTSRTIPNATTIPGLVVYRYDAPLCFANVDELPPARPQGDRGRDRAGGVAPAQHGSQRRDRLERDRHARRPAQPPRVAWDRDGARPRQTGPRVRTSTAPVWMQRIGADHIFPTLPTALEASGPAPVSTSE